MRQPGVGLAEWSPCLPPFPSPSYLPARAQLDADFGLSKEQLERLTERVVHRVTWGTKTLQRLFLVDDTVESLKVSPRHLRNPFPAEHCDKHRHPTSLCQNFAGHKDVILRDQAQLVQGSHVQLDCTGRFLH